MSIKNSNGLKPQGVNVMDEWIKNLTIPDVSKSVDAEAEFCKLCKDKTVFKEVNSKRCISCGNVC
jgi:hypothetical protein